MNKKIFSLSMACLVTSILFGCGGGDTSTTTGGSTATPTPTPTPAPLTCNTRGGGLDPATEGFFVPNATTTITSVTLTVSAQTGAPGSTGLTLTAKPCGFTTSVVGTATTSVNLAQAFNYYTVTFTFSTPIPVQNCSGQGTVAFTLSSTNPIYYGGQNGTGSSCTIRSSTNNTDVTPSPRAGNWYVTGSYQ